MYKVGQVILILTLDILLFQKMCALKKMPEYRKKYTKKEMTAAIGVCEDMEYSLDNADM